MYLIDRDQVKADYEAGLSYRELSAKYGVSIATLSRWAKAGRWDIEQIRNSVPIKPAKETKHKQKTKHRKTEQNETDGTGPARITEPAVSSRLIIRDPADPDEMYGESAGAVLAEYERVRASARRALDVIDVMLAGEKLTPRDIKSITGALADIKNELGALSPRELREQQARLRQLERSLQEKKQEPVEIVFVNTEGCEV